MYSIAILGQHNPGESDIVATVLARLCRRSGFEDLSLYQGAAPPPAAPDAYTLSANLTRILIAAGYGTELIDVAYRPGREQIRLATSGYLLSELPLGQFAEDRYGAPHLNITQAGLSAVVAATDSPQVQPPLAELEKEFPLVINTCAEATNNTHGPTHTLWQANIPQAPENANITWLADHATAWQCSTLKTTHYWFTVPVQSSPDEHAWPAPLAEAARIAQLLMPFSPTESVVREHWTEGNVAHLGRACYSPLPYRREAWLLGLEDAWVISRMLENYEEALHEGLAQYARFRRPRAIKVQRTSNETQHAYLVSDKLAQAKRNLGIAFRTRFLPEMAMQRIDWLYQYDCIKGFH